MAGVADKVGTGALALNVAVTVGLGDTPAALKVITQEWLPAVTPVAFTEAVTVAGVEPDAGDKASQAQSEPREEVNAKPLAGLVLLSAIVCAAGAVAPMT